MQLKEDNVRLAQEQKALKAQEEELAEAKRPPGDFFSQFNTSTR